MLYEFGLHNIELPGATPELTANARIIYWHQGRIITQGADIAWSLQSWPMSVEGLQHVALLDGRPYFTAELPVLPDGVETSSLRDVAFLSETAFSLCARARALLDWRMQHRFCGQCGQPTLPVDAETATQCHDCRLRFYPRISPCVIVLITRGDQVLLALGERHRDSGMFSTLAGFIESGESAEQAVVREVKEEVNIDVRNIQYLNSQAWPFPNQLMLAYSAEYAGGEIIPAEGEIVAADWFHLDALPKHPPSISIAGWMIQQYIQKRRSL